MHSFHYFGIRGFCEKYPWMSCEFKNDKTRNKTQKYPDKKKLAWLKNKNKIDVWNAYGLPTMLFIHKEELFQYIGGSISIHCKVKLVKKIP